MDERLFKALEALSTAVDALVRTSMWQAVFIVALAAMAAINGCRIHRLDQRMDAIEAEATP